MTMTKGVLRNGNGLDHARVPRASLRQVLSLLASSAIVDFPDSSSVKSWFNLLLNRIQMVQVLAITALLQMALFESIEQMIQVLLMLLEQLRVWRL